MTTTIWVIAYKYWDQVDEEYYEYFHIDEDGFYMNQFAAQRACDRLNMEQEKNYKKHVKKLHDKNTKRKEDYENKLLDHKALVGAGRPSKAPDVPEIEEIPSFEQWTMDNYAPIALPKPLESREYS